MKKFFILTLIMAVMTSSSLFAQHRAVKTTTDPNTGAAREYGISNTLADRVMTADPTILWEKYDNAAVPEDVFYIDATGDYLVYYGLNNKRVSLFDANGNLKWEKPISDGGRAAVSASGNTIAYSDTRDLYVVDIEGEEIFHETFDYSVSHFKLNAEGSRIYVSYGNYDANYYAIACYNTTVTKSEPVWLIGDLTVNVVGISLSKDDMRLVASFAQGYRQIWVIDPMTGDIIQDDLPYYDNSPSQDPALSANGDYLAYADFSGMAYLYHWNGERYEKVWNASIAGAGASSTWGCANAISDDGSIIAIGTLDFVGSGYDGACYLFNNYSNIPIWSYSGCGDEVTQAAMSDDGSIIGFASWGPMDHATPDFFLFRKQSNVPIAELTTPGSMEHIDISSDGSIGIFGGKAVHCREMGNGCRIYAIQGITDNTGTLSGTVNLEGNENNSGVTITINELEGNGVVYIILSIQSQLLANQVIRYYRGVVCAINSNIRIEAVVVHILQSIETIVISIAQAAVLRERYEIALAVLSRDDDLHECIIVSLCKCTTCRCRSIAVTRVVPNSVGVVHGFAGRICTCHLHDERLH